MSNLIKHYDTLQATSKLMDHSVSGQRNFQKGAGNSKIIASRTSNYVVTNQGLRKSMMPNKGSNFGGSNRSLGQISMGNIDEKKLR